MSFQNRPELSAKPGMTAWEQVGEFHAACQISSPDRACAEIDPELKKLRARLLDEEVSELSTAVSEDDIVGIADALGDIMYIICGTAHVYGINLDDVFAEIHRSNMTKFDSQGQPLRRADGKILKGPYYSPPDIRRVLS